MQYVVRVNERERERERGGGGSGESGRETDVPATTWLVGKQG